MRLSILGLTLFLWPACASVAQCPGDLDGDGDVDAGDVSIAHLSLFLPPGPSGAPDSPPSRVPTD